MRKLLLLNIVLLLLLSSLVYGSCFETYYGGEPFSILKLGTDPYQVSVGGISSILGGGGNSSLINPAGLGLVEEMTFETGVMKPFWDVEGDLISTIAFSLPVKFGYGSIGTLGLGVFYQRTGSQIRYRLGEEPRSFTPTNTLLTFGWGKGFGGNPILEIPNNSYFGFSLNIYQVSVDIYSDSGFGLNFGFFRNFTEHIRVGFLATNIITPQIKLIETPDSIPFNLRVGLGIYPVKYFGFLSELESDLDGKLTARFGGYFRYEEYFRISSGYETRRKKPSFGVGVKVRNIGIDYAVFLNSDLGVGNLINISLEF